MAQQLTEQMKYWLIVDHVNVVQSQHKRLADLIEVIKYVASDSTRIGARVGASSRSQVCS